MVERSEERRVGREGGSRPASGAKIIQQRMYWVYILQNPQGRFYVGHSDDLPARLDSHNRCDAVVGKLTVEVRGLQLCGRQVHATRALAMNRERAIKAMKSARWIRQHLLNGGEIGRASCRERGWIEACLWSQNNTTANVLGLYSAKPSRAFLRWTQRRSPRAAGLSQPVRRGRREVNGRSQRVAVVWAASPCHARPGHESRAGDQGDEIGPLDPPAFAQWW